MNKLLTIALLVFALSVPAAFASAPVDINTADAVTLEQIKGIGPTRAKAIVEHREQHGPFATVDDLALVSGIGAKTVEQLREHVTASR